MSESLVHSKRGFVSGGEAFPSLVCIASPIIEVALSQFRFFLSFLFGSFIFQGRRKLLWLCLVIEGGPRR